MENLSDHLIPDEPCCPSEPNSNQRTCSWRCLEGDMCGIAYSKLCIRKAHFPPHFFKLPPHLLIKSHFFGIGYAQNDTHLKVKEHHTSRQWQHWSRVYSLFAFLSFWINSSQDVVTSKLSTLPCLIHWHPHNQNMIDCFTIRSCRSLVHIYQMNE